MATPPPLPKDALKSPPKAVVEGSNPSPWDAETSVPPPASSSKSAKGLGMPSWLGRSIVHPDHAQELELNSAVNEFGLKMPRQQAEDHAYAEYVKGQHVAAQAHHLAGIKAADGAGDKEASRKHRMMYDMHAKAMGHEPVGAPHPDVTALMNKGPSNIYKFKAHRGDAFAIEPPPQGPTMPQHGGVLASSPPPSLGKNERELLYLLHQAGTAILSKAEKIEQTPYNPVKTGTIEVPKKPLREGTFGADRLPKVIVKKDEMSPSKKSHCKCEAYKFPHRHGGGYCRQKKS